MHFDESSTDDVRERIDCARRTNRIALDEASGKHILSMYGIRVPRSKTIHGPDQVEAALRDLSLPCALKIVSPDIIHKSDFGGVALNLGSESAVCDAIARMTAMARDQHKRVEGFLVEEMAPPGHAIVIGAYRDPSFGLLVMFGLGGTFVELLRDLSFRLCPIDVIDAREMIGELKGSPILAGARGGLAVSEPMLVDALMAIAGKGGLIESLAADFDEIDINPLIASASGVIAVDARFVLARGDDRNDRDDRDDRVMARADHAAQSVLQKFEPLFRPSTIAVAGASGKSAAQGNAFIRNLKEAGFEGDIYPIHPSEATIEGLPAYPSLADTPQPIDYAFVAIAAERVPALLAGANGRVHIAQVMSSGFGEVAEGRGLEKELVASARLGGMRLLGPNCMGTYSPRGRCSFMAGGLDTAGSVGIMSQSGGLSMDILRIGRFRGVRYSGVVSLGNCADLDAGDLLEYYLADPDTRVIGAYIEHIRDGRQFFEKLRAARAAKPVVILKGGRSDQGSRAAISHTGALAGGHEAWRALARQTGSLLVESLDEFIDCLAAFQVYEPVSQPPTGRVVLFGNGGGASVLATDCLASLGLDVAPLEPAAAEALRGLDLGAGTSVANPIDVPANVLRRERGALAQRILETVAAHATPWAILMHLNLPVLLGYRHIDMVGDMIGAAQRARAALHGSTHVVLALRAGGDPESQARRRECASQLADAGVAVFDDIENAARALSAIRTYESFRFARRAVTEGAAK